MAYYNKTTEKTSIDGKIAGMDVTSAVLTSKELGLYQSYNPTGFAPVTNQVREFDWGTKVQPAINTVGTIIGSYSDAQSQIGEFIWNNGGKQVAVGAIVAGATIAATYLAIQTFGVGATVSGAMVVGSLAVANKVLESDK